MKSKYILFDTDANKGMISNMESQKLNSVL